MKCIVYIKRHFFASVWFLLQHPYRSESTSCFAMRTFRLFSQKRECNNLTLIIDPQTQIVTLQYKWLKSLKLHNKILNNKIYWKIEFQKPEHGYK